MTTLSNRIKKTRVALGRSAIDVSNAAGLSKNTVNEIERNPDRSPRVEHVQAIAKTLGVSLAYLAEGIASNGGEITDASDLVSPVIDGHNPAAIDRLIEILAPRAKNPIAFSIRQRLCDFSLVQGDLVIVEQTEQANLGDLVAVTLTDLPSGSTRLILRRYLQPYLIAAENKPGQAALVADGVRAKIAGPVVAVARGNSWG